MRLDRGNPKACYEWAASLAADEDPSGCRVALVADWSRASRGLFWIGVLDELRRQRRLTTKYWTYPLAELARSTADGASPAGITGRVKDASSGCSNSAERTYRPQGAGTPLSWMLDLTRRRTPSDRETRGPPGSLVRDLQERDVLIVSWDVVNGDPDFGADVALRWFLHRRPEILLWVANGGVLIIESQAALSVPSQAAYDALLGPSELRVSGPSEKPHSRVEAVRIGRFCRLTKLARSSSLFQGPAQLAARKPLTHDDMFPGFAGELLTTYLRDPDWSATLYRGWFSWRPFTRTRLRWAAIAETADRRWNHATLVAAKHGNGAIFASTMLLSNTSLSLVQSLLSCRGQSDRVPDPPRVAALIEDHARHLAVLLAGAVLGILLPWLNAALGLNTSLPQGVADIVAGAGGAVGLWLLLRVPGAVRRILEAVFGW
jgi:hypothetical protein